MIKYKNREVMKMKEKKTIECPICGEIMEEYLYDYNSDPEEKVNYKCPNCGHRICKLKKY